MYRENGKLTESNKNQKTIKMYCISNKIYKMSHDHRMTPTSLG